MRVNDVVRVLEDPLYGWAPIGSVDEMKEGWVRVRLDDPGYWGRSFTWLREHELEVVDIAKWEKAIKDG